LQRGIQSVVWKDAEEEKTISPGRPILKGLQKVRTEKGAFRGEREEPQECRFEVPTEEVGELTEEG